MWEERKRMNDAQIRRVSSKGGEGNELIKCRRGEEVRRINNRREVAFAECKHECACPRFPSPPLPLPLSVLCFLRVETAVGAGTDGRRKDGTEAPKSSPTVALRTKAARSLPPPTPDEGEETPRSKCHERRAARARRTRRHSSERVVRGEPCTPLPLLLIRDFKKFDNFTRNQTELPHSSVACRSWESSSARKRLLPTPTRCGEEGTRHYRDAPFMSEIKKLLASRFFVANWK